MKYVKRWLVITAVLGTTTFSSYVIGHSGGTDKFGCHIDHSNGIRHCH